MDWEAFGANLLCQGWHRSEQGCSLRWSQKLRNPWRNAAVIPKTKPSLYQSATNNPHPYAP